MKTPTAPAIRFRKKYRVDETTGCWEWTGSRDGAHRHTTRDRRGEYGRFALDGYRMIGAHRASFIMFRGEIPEGMVVCHTCDNPPCVNPAHLFLGSMQDNSDDMCAKGRSWHQSGMKPPRLGTGVGRKVRGKGCVVDATCVVCGAAALHRITALRQGRSAVCSPRCKSEYNSRRTSTKREVPCAECGATTLKTPRQIAKQRNVFCSLSCVGTHNARERWSA